jgi:glycerol uptake operon antiterminator
METNQNLAKKLSEKPVIAALCKESDLDDLCLSNVKVAFILCGSMATLPEIVRRIRQARILPFVYIDFIGGLSTKDGAVDFVKYYTEAAGIVTTKSNQIKRAHALELLAVQRFFVFDAISLNNIKNQVSVSVADACEVLPGVIPTVISTISAASKMPLIVGGFVNTQQDLDNAREHGACAITTSVPDMWFL